jgi:hypothetical protein
MEAFPLGLKAHVGMPYGAPPLRLPESLARARDLNVIGEGGEAAWKGVAPAEESAVAAAEVARPPETPPEPPIAAPAPDVHAIARQIDPKTFEEFDALAKRRDVFRRWIEDPEDAGRDLTKVAANLKETEARIKELEPAVTAAYEKAKEGLPAEAMVAPAPAPPAAAQAPSGPLRTGQPHIDAILSDPETARAIEKPVVNRTKDVPYTAGPDETGNGLNIDRHFPQSFTVDLDGTVRATTQGDSAAGFKTGKGSIYELHEDGTTTRNKAARSDLGHEGDSGPKPRSSKTVYIIKDARVFNPPDSAKWRVVDHGNGTMSLAVQNTDGRWGISPESRNIKFETVPRIGLQPLELWKPDTLNGLPAYRGVHPGNAITELTVPKAGGKTYDPAEPFAAHEFSERDAINKLMAAGMSEQAAYRVAHWEVAEPAEGAWYKSRNIDQAKAEAAYQPFIDQIEHEKLAKGDGDVPENLFRKPYPHDNVNAAAKEKAAVPKPTAAEIKRGREILAGKAAKPIAEQKAYIEADVKRQLLAAGKPTDLTQARWRQVVDDTSKLWAKRYEERAATLQGAAGTAEELYNREAAEPLGHGQRSAEAAPRAPRKIDESKLSLVQFLAHRGGIQETPDLRHTLDRNPFVPGFGRLFRREGMTVDAAREAASEAGYLPENVERTGKQASIKDLYAALSDENRGRKRYRMGHEPEEAVREGEAPAEHEEFPEGVEPHELAPEYDEPRSGLMTKEDEDALALLQKEQAPPFYSAVSRAVDTAKQAKASASQWLGTLKNTPGVKPEEMEWLGLEDWLKEQKGAVTKEQIADYVRANQIEVKEVEKGAVDTSDRLQKLEAQRATVRDQLNAERVRHGNLTGDVRLHHIDEMNALNDKYDDIGREIQNVYAEPTKYHSYQIPGGENYREMLMTLPEESGPGAQPIARMKEIQRRLHEITNLPTAETDTSTPKGRFYLEEYDKLRAERKSLIDELPNASRSCP